MGYRVINGKLHLIENFKSYDKSKNTETKKTTTSFKDVLEKQINTKESFIISKHAAERLRQRNISFNQADMKNINEGINKAEEKGCQESLILYKDTALITSIKNRTIITAVDTESSKGNVFTNVDSVIML
jgi:flagellar operon protein